MITIDTSRDWSVDFEEAISGNISIFVFTISGNEVEINKEKGGVEYFVNGEPVNLVTIDDKNIVFEKIDTK